MYSQGGNLDEAAADFRAAIMVEPKSKALRQEFEKIKVMRKKAAETMKNQMA